MIHRPDGWYEIHEPRVHDGWREIAAAAIDPLTGFNRLITGDASRVSDKPSALVPSSVSGIGSTGVVLRCAIVDARLGGTAGQSARSSLAFLGRRAAADQSRTLPRARRSWRRSKKSANAPRARDLTRRRVTPPNSPPNASTRERFT